MRENSQTISMKYPKTKEFKRLFLRKYPLPKRVLEVIDSNERVLE